MYDVVISGAGPAGSHCAKVLAEAGYNVALIEKNTAWRKPCGGLVSSRVLKLYPEMKKLKTLKIVGAKLYSSDYIRLVYTRTDDKYSTIVDRLDFDDLIRNVAIDAGAKLFDRNLSFDFVSKAGVLSGVKTKTKEGGKEYLGKIVILADGMSSRLAIRSGLRSKWTVEDIGRTKAAILEGEHNLGETYGHLFFQHYMGYAWLFPMGERRFNIGCGTFGDANSKFNLNEIFNDFLQEPKIKELVPESNYKIIWSAAYPVPANGVLINSLYANNLMLIGDTAGFVSPITGEGIYQSIFSAQASAEVAIEALEREDYSAAMLKKYRRHPKVKQIVGNFKTKLRLRKFFYEEQGKNLSEMFARAEKDHAYRDEALNMFFSKD